MRLTGRVPLCMEVDAKGAKAGFACTEMPLYEMRIIESITVAWGIQSLIFSKKVTLGCFGNDAPTPFWTVQAKIIMFSRTKSSLRRFPAAAKVFRPATRWRQTITRDGRHRPVGKPAGKSGAAPGAIPASKICIHTRDGAGSSPLALMLNLTSFTS